MRKYEAIWEELKRAGRCEIRAHPKMQPRVKKAVIKEKYNDIAYKVLLDEKEATIETFVKEEDEELMVFVLHQTITVEDL
jgi:hypothetical protein